MTAFKQHCLYCRKEYITYFPEAYSDFCCIGCEVDYYASDGEVKPVGKIKGNFDEFSYTDGEGFVGVEE